MTLVQNRRFKSTPAVLGVPLGLTPWYFGQVFGIKIATETMDYRTVLFELWYV